MTDKNSNPAVPVHVSIIMDGNGRWAQMHGKQRWEGHAEGAVSLHDVLEEASKQGVKYLSVYAFSEENWKRSEKEVGAIMSLMMSQMSSQIEDMHRSNVRFMVLGNRSRLAPEMNRSIDACMEKTRGNTGITFILLFSYSGRWDLLQAVQSIAAECAARPSSVGSIDENCISDHLVTRGIPDPDLIIRTSGEQRVSNYLLWQCAYSEFYFTDVLWPDFRSEEFRKALKQYAGRDRRYGKTR